MRALIRDGAEVWHWVIWLTEWRGNEWTVAGLLAGTQCGQKVSAESGDLPRGDGFVWFVPDGFTVQGKKCSSCMGAP